MIESQAFHSLLGRQYTQGHRASKYLCCCLTGEQGFVDGPPGNTHQNNTMGLERGLSSLEHVLLLQRTRVQLQAPMSSVSQPPVTTALRDVVPLSGLRGHHTCGIHSHSHPQKDINNINLEQTKIPQMSFKGQIVKQTMVCLCHEILSSKQVQNAVLHIMKLYVTAFRKKKYQNRSGNMFAEMGQGKNRKRQAYGIILHIFYAPI